MKAFKNCETPEEIKNYLDHAFTYVRDSVFHYTSLDALLCIYHDKQFKFSKFNKTNDCIENNFVTDEIKNKKYLCFMRTMQENYGMWAMYGGLTNCNKEKTLKNSFVKIKIPVDKLKIWICENNLKSNLIAYTNIQRNFTKVLKCGFTQNNKDINIDPAILSGYIKDNAWEYEKELRVWSEKDYISLSEDFLSSFTVFTSPLMNKSECEKILKTDSRYNAIKHLLNIEVNDYYKSFKPRDFNNEESQ